MIFEHNLRAVPLGVPRSLVSDRLWAGHAARVNRVGSCARFKNSSVREFLMEIELSLEFLRVVEQAAIESAKTMGLGDGHKADQAAVESMRKVMVEVPMDGTIAIGEGERDDAPMLFIGERIGAAQHVRGFNFPAVDIAVDPLEGTNLCATGAPGSITVLAASEKGGLLHAPDL